MAFKFPGANFFAAADAKSRIFLVVIVVIIVALGIYFGARYFSGEATTTGASKVAAAPTNLQSVPGGQLTPEYYQAQMQLSAQSAQQAQMTGGSAVPILVNVPNQPGFGSQNCTVLCPSEDSPNVANDINNLVKLGKLSQADANRLLDMAKANVSVDEYAAELDRLVREGKLTPEQARQLLAQYKKQHANNLVTESAGVMDSMIKSGQLPLQTATELLTLQKNNISFVFLNHADTLLQVDGSIHSTFLPVPRLHVVLYIALIIFLLAPASFCRC